MLNDTETTTTTITPAAKRPSRCASDRLYHNEVRDFEDAMRAVLQACADERRTSQDFNAHLEPGERPLDTGIFDGYATAARQALAIYEKHVSAAMEAARAELRAKATAAPDSLSDLEHFAQAWESGDYSALAI